MDSASPNLLTRRHNGTTTQRSGYRHDDPRYSDCDRSNAHAHLRATLLGRPIALAVADAEVLLGQYQSVILAELDGPRERRLQVQIVGE